ncbi:flagellar motor protein MotB [Solitalea longa]|uniref:Flagellar motor protein MotB n=1 Tax=Solitalea longa TaxID=2079460 RepID=A0A2S5A2U3_9SPHI|nr:OmpA family protein [Solitalea longa]POY36908.1 flagellar motor protein MotB [Solitalea longa]
MATNIVDSLKSLVTPDLVLNTSSMLGESSGNISSAFGLSFPSILAGLLNKSTDMSAMSGLYSMMQGAGTSNILSDPGSLVSELGAGGSGIIDQGKQFLSSLFGNKTAELSTTIGSAAGIKSSSASSILAVAAPLVLSFLGNKVNTEGLGLSGLTSFLGSQKDNIINAAPAGLGSLLGIGSLSNLGSSAASAVKSTMEGTGKRAESSTVRNLILLAVGILAVFFLWRSCNKKEDMSTVPSTVDSLANKAETMADSAASMASDALAKLGAFFKKKLPNGIELNIPEMGIENKLLAFIEDTSKPVDKTTWFSFDRLTFETGSAVLKPESEEQLKNIAEILKAYPNVEVKLGGYTDNVGDAATNLKLSADRANNVKAELEKLGIDGKRIAAEGYGQDHPVASNDTEEGKAQNRRIDIRVTKK